MLEPAATVETSNEDSVPPFAAEEAYRRKRTHVEREWPPVGTRLIAECLGVFRASLRPYLTDIRHSRPMSVGSCHPWAPS